jgi:putative RecB family exonuclease
MARYSNTKLSTYEECPQKYKFRYIDGIDRPHETIEAFVGILVHQALAKLYADLKESRTNSCEDLLEFYEAQWKASYGPHVKTVRRDRTPDSYFTAGQRMISDYYRKNLPFQAGEMLGTEIEVSMVMHEDCEFHGIVDRLARTGDKSYEIHDYKTSARLPLERTLQGDRQLAMYELAIRQRWPNAEAITLVWHYLRFSKEFRLQKSKDDLDAVKQGALRVIQEIERARTFPTKESSLCDWCEYYDVCPAKHKPAK